MLKVATFIVDKRNLIFLLIGIAIVFSLFAAGWVTVENDLTAYLPSGSATKEGLDVMEEEFITYGSADIMVANVSYEEATELLDLVKAIVLCLNGHLLGHETDARILHTVELFDGGLHLCRAVGAVQILQLKGLFHRLFLLIMIIYCESSASTVKD